MFSHILRKLWRLRIRMAGVQRYGRATSYTDSPFLVTSHEEERLSGLFVSG